MFAYMHINPVKYLFEHHTQNTLKLSPLTASESKVPFLPGTQSLDIPYSFRHMGRSFIVLNCAVELVE